MGGRIGPRYICGREPAYERACYLLLILLLNRILCLAELLGLQYGVKRPHSDC